MKYEEKKKLIDSQLPEVCRTAVEQARDKGASSWLTAIPLEQQGFQLNKEEFKADFLSWQKLVATIFFQKK